MMPLGPMVSLTMHLAYLLFLESQDREKFRVSTGTQAVLFTTNDETSCYAVCMTVFTLVWGRGGGRETLWLVRSRDANIYEKRLQVDLVDCTCCILSLRGRDSKAWL